MPKDRSELTKSKNRSRHDPLAADEDRTARILTKKKLSSKSDKSHSASSQKFRQKLLQQVRKQQKDLQGEHFLDQNDSKATSTWSCDSSDSDWEDTYEEWNNINDDLDSRAHSNSDEELLLNHQLVDGASSPHSTYDRLDQAILEKLEQESMSCTNAMDTSDTDFHHDHCNVSQCPPTFHYNAKVIESYQLIAKLLKNYTSGPLPKAFKIIPSLINWQQILELTNPAEWSPQATYAATRLFASNLNEHLAQTFYSLVLYPHFRENIRNNKKLNCHLYASLKKTLYKPGAFYKGILFPLCESNNCTLREMAILGSIIKKNTIPSSHSSVAIYKLAQLPSSSAVSFFIGTLLKKKYALPYEVIDMVVEHFLSRKKDQLPCTVMWHQCLLILVQHYKEDLTAKQKEQIKALVNARSHHAITPEIRSELASSAKTRDQAQ
ncbi:bystin-like [Schistocerca gregaria]|uniref:bystin-like n=1 Tax=Schistocerca gregaria TaxID=7010 RepID=UPI00211E4667|nr:bystin-like [Schistocerca gregaria]